MIAALFVQRNGCYFDTPHVDPWDEDRDARLYRGPHRVIAHPPCERWGRYWQGGPALVGTGREKKLGDDNGCFEAAIRAVREFGGVLEHPAGTHAWARFGIKKPPPGGGWVVADEYNGMTCVVEQGWYGHRARKRTWLYACGVNPPELRWGKAPGNFSLLEDGKVYTKEERRRLIRTGKCQRMSKRQRAATPVEFRDLLISIVQRGGD